MPDFTQAEPAPGRDGSAAAKIFRRHRSLSSP